MRASRRQPLRMTHWPNDQDRVGAIASTATRTLLRSGTARMLRERDALCNSNLRAVMRADADTPYSPAPE
jgi:hypothetical protein